MSSRQGSRTDIKYYVLIFEIRHNRIMNRFYLSTEPRSALGGPLYEPQELAESWYANLIYSPPAVGVIISDNAGLARSKLEALEQRINNIAIGCSSVSYRTQKIYRPSLYSCRLSVGMADVTRRKFLFRGIRKKVTSFYVKIREYEITCIYIDFCRNREN